MIKYYDKKKRAESNLPKIPNNIVWTDQCGSQYKCRHNFLKVATSYHPHGSRIIHKFAIKYNFKGSWDATSKIVRHFVLKSELKFIRIANAIDLYCIGGEEMTKEKDVGK